MADLVEKLTGLIEYECGVRPVQEVYRECRDEIKALQAENERLREALKPFIEAADEEDIRDEYQDDWSWEIVVLTPVIRRARGVLAERAKEREDDNG